MLIQWETQTPYDDLDITINLSKPEKSQSDRGSPKRKTGEVSEMSALRGK